MSKSGDLEAGGSREAEGVSGSYEGGSGTMGVQGASGAWSAPGPCVSFLCLTHPHGGNGGSGPQLFFPTLAGREAATAATVAAATPERRRAQHRACAPRAPPRALVGTAPAHNRRVGDGRG